MNKSLVLEFESKRQSTLVIRPGAIFSLSDHWRSSWEEAVVIGDATVLALFGQTIQKQLKGLVPKVDMLSFEPGEKSKTRGVKEQLEDRMLALGFSRRACVVGLGGGVSLDLAGYVAATFLRSVPSVLVPTSLLAQVDASVGGKTGVNTLLGKNLIGAFFQPSLVLIDPQVTASLPLEQWRNGLAEMIKHAVIADGNLFDRFEQSVDVLSDPARLPGDLLYRSIEIKAFVVRQDETETGLRAILNFGHTVGHAIECFSQYRIAHGVALSMGMLTEAALAVHRCGLDPLVVKRLKALLGRLGLRNFESIAFQEIREHLRMDKKNKRGRIHMVLPASLGEMAKNDEQYTFAVSPEELQEVWTHDLR
jgi:3-dehydroquinate synthase